MEAPISLNKKYIIMKKRYLIVAFMVSSMIGMAQNSADVLRYSQAFNGGSARYMAMGGAFSSLGADFSVLSTNPAGIGVYKRSELSFSPSLYFSNTLSTTGVWQDEGRKNNFNMNNYGLVMVQRMNKDKSGWKSFQFGMGVNRLNNFNREYSIINHNQSSSLITDYQDQSYGKYPDQLDAFTTDLAWKTYLFEDTTRVNGGVLAYTSALNNGGAKQTERVLEWGSVNEMLFAMGGSYNDKIYIGGAVGFPFARYFQQVQHKEVDDMDTITGFKSFTMNRYLETHGSGVNFKLGVIVRPLSFLRFGFSFQSPTWYNMRDYWYNDMSQNFENGSSLEEKSPNGNFDYKISTPLKLNGSVGIVLGKIMLISAEAEYLDYSSAFLSSRVYTFSDENTDVRDKFTSTVNLKAGMEFRLSPMAFRLGAAYYGNPYRSGINESARYQFSGGLGYRDKDFFIDMAYVYSMASEDYYMYDPAFVDASNIKSNMHQLVMSIGMKF